MKRAIANAITMATAFLALCGAGVAFAQATVTVEIEPEGGRSEVLPLLPVCLTIRVTNSGDRPTSLCPLGPDSLSPPAMYQFVIQRPDGKVMRAALADFTYIFFPGLGYNPNWKRAIAPGETWVQDYCLGYGMVFDNKATTNASLLETVGRYTVRLEMPFLVEGGAKSNEIAITVKAPEKESDRAAYERIHLSPFASILLAPPLYGTWGCPLMTDSVFPPMKPGLRDFLLDLLARYPDSIYAPYVRLLLASGLHLGSEATSIDERLKAYRWLRQCAEDPKLPRRYREEAILRLRSASNLDWQLRMAVKSELPPVESLLGRKVDLRGLSDRDIYSHAYQIARGPEQTRLNREKILAARFTPEQIEILKTAATSDPAVVLAVGGTEIQQELRKHAHWASGELSKIPWRDPITGRLRMGEYTPGFW